MTLIYIIIFSLLGGILSVIAASLFLFLKKEVRTKIIPNLVSFATGTLLTAALLGLIPHSLEQLKATKTLGTVLVGVFIFFALEKIVIWRHCHKDDCDVHDSSGAMILIGDTIHNFVDGVVIAASFMVSVPVGIAASLSIAAHEIPQELGDFAILLHSGYSKGKALFYNILSGLASLVGGIIAYISLEKIDYALPYVMSIAASSFIYVALVDLSPGLHKRPGLRQSVKQIVLIAAGALTILFLLQFHHD